MSTVREQVLEAIVTALNTSRPTGVPEANRSRYLQVTPTPDAPKFMDVRFIEDDELPVPDTDDESVLQLHHAQVVVDSYAIGIDGTTPEQEADKMAAWIAKALNRNRLGGLVTSLRVRKSIVLQPVADRAYIRLRTGLLVKFTSRAMDAEQRV